MDTGCNPDGSLGGGSRDLVHDGWIHSHPHRRRSRRRAGPGDSGSPKDVTNPFEALDGRREEAYENENDRAALAARSGGGRSRQPRPGSPLPRATRATEVARPPRRRRPFPLGLARALLLTARRPRSNIHRPSGGHGLAPTLVAGSATRQPLFAVCTSSARMNRNDRPVIAPGRSSTIIRSCATFHRCEEVPFGRSPVGPWKSAG